MTIAIHPIYAEFFPENGSSPNNWDRFQISAAQTDFSITPTLGATVQKIALFVMKIVLFPWGLYELTKAIVDRVAMAIVYPAQHLDKKNLSQLKIGWRHFAETTISRDLTLEKNGIRYNGLLAAKQETISNGKWALFATGNATCFEHAFLSNTHQSYFNAGYNVLYVNGPGVGESEGGATVERIGDAQEVGISFLETALKAKRIVLAGHSLGGAAIGLAVRQHEFKPDVNYLAIRMMTFDRLSHIATKLVGCIAGFAIRFFGLEMDSVEASKTLADNHIREIVLQGQEDELMRGVSLLEALEEEGLMRGKTGENGYGLEHNTLPNNQITQYIQNWDLEQEEFQAV